MKRNNVLLKRKTNDLVLMKGKKQEKKMERIKPFIFIGLFFVLVTHPKRKKRERNQCD
jgi:hypothetical protein